MEKRARKYPEVRVTLKEDVKKELDERLKNTPYVTLNELVRNLIYDYVKCNNVSTTETNKTQFTSVLSDTKKEEVKNEKISDKGENKKKLNFTRQRMQKYILDPDKKHYIIKFLEGSFLEIGVERDFIVGYLIIPKNGGGMLIGNKLKSLLSCFVKLFKEEDAVGSFERYYLEGSFDKYNYLICALNCFARENNYIIKLYHIRNRYYNREIVSKTYVVYFIKEINENL